MARYKINGTGVIDTVTGSSIPNSMGNRHWLKYLKWVDEGNVADLEHTYDEVQLEKILDEYDESMKKIIECTVGEETYKMQAGKKHYETFKNGIDIAELYEETETYIVEYDNTLHENIPIEDAKEVLKQMGWHNREAHKTKNIQRNLLN